MRRPVFLLACLSATAVTATPTGVQDPVPPPIPPVESVTELGPMQQNPVVTGRDGGFSVLFRGRSIWTFGDTAMSVTGDDGDNWENNTLASTTDLHGSDGFGPWLDHLDSAGVPSSFLPETRKERLYNRRHGGPDCDVEPCDAEYALWPAQSVADPDRNRLLLFYTKIHRVVGEDGWRPEGAGIAVWKPGRAVVRPVARPGTADLTIMWPPNQIAYTAGSLIDGGQLYSYGCYPDWVVQHCQLARVPLADVLDRSAWRFYGGGEGWSANPAAAVTVFDGGAAGTTVEYNSYLDDYLAIYMAPLTNYMMFRVADTPWGPWSDDTLLFEGLPGWSGSIDYAGLAHWEYAEQRGKVQYLTYVRTTGFLRQEMRQVKVVFGAPPAARSDASPSLPLSPSPRTQGA